VRYAPLPGFLRFMAGPELDAYNPYTPEPGWYAISATSLRLGLLNAGTQDLYAYFRALTPVGRAGYSIYLYQVSYPSSTEIVRPVVVGTSLARLTRAELGIRPSCRSQVKWVQSPEAEVYPLGEGFTLPTEFRPVNANFADVMTLLGYTVAPEHATPGASLAFTLYWQVGTAPLAMPAPTRASPLAAFVHLVVEEPSATVAQCDGWHTALRGLEPSDVVVHQLEIELPDGLAAGEYPILVGLYSPQSGERLLIAGPPPADHAQVGRIRVR
jgi:hypothetical protein